MRKVLCTTLLIIPSFFLYSQKMVTPGTGVKWTLDSLVTHFPASITNLSPNLYTMVDSLEVATNDSLVIHQPCLWELDSAVMIDIYGTLLIDGDPNSMVVINAIDSTKPYHGFRFEEFSHVSLNMTGFVYGGGLRVLTEDFSMKNCIVAKQNAGASTSSAIGFSRGKPVVAYSSVADNYTTGFSSGANVECAPRILHNYIARNNQDNSNRPQINLGPSGMSDTTLIIGNIVEGDSSLDMVGGIAVSSLLSVPCNAVIDSNEVFNNRYGITMAGANIFGYMRYNVLEDNNTQNLPMSGGSGISLSAGSPTLNVVATGNEIRRNLWGITIIGQASVNLGDTADATFNPGENIFADNGNGGVNYALYNNTPLAFNAMNNCWIEDSNASAVVVEDVIFHLNDDPALGEVFYTPLGLCKDTTGGDPLAIGENSIRVLEIFPNPSTGIIQVGADQPATISVFTVTGKLIRRFKVNSGEEKIKTNLSPGVYILRTELDGQTYSGRLLMK